MIRLMIRLDARLRCAFDMLKGARSVADIGCDHGKLSAALLLDGGCQRVIAGDISPDCLNKTREIITRYGLQDRAEVRLGSGLTILTPGECDAAAILGMGGELMIELLEASPEVASSLNRLVLQPMSGIEELRQWLYESSYHVIEDRLVAIGHRWYQLLSVHKGDIPGLSPRLLAGGVSFLRGSGQAPQTLLRGAANEAPLAAPPGRGDSGGGPALPGSRTTGTDHKGDKPMELAKFCACMDQIAPRPLALDFDNVGLLVEPDHAVIKKVLIALDCTTVTAREATPPTPTWTRRRAA